MIEDFVKSAHKDETISLNNIAKVFLQMYESAVDRMESDRKLSAKLLYNMTYLSNELLSHFQNKQMLDAIKEYAKNLPSLKSKVTVPELKKEVAEDSNRLKPDKTFM